MKIFVSLLMVLALAGCLKTRSELKTDPSGSMRTGTDGRYVNGNVGQQQRAQIDSRFFEIDRDFRQLYGKIEVLEAKLNEMDTAKPNAEGGEALSEAEKAKMAALEKRVATLEEALIALDKKVGNLSKGGNSASNLVDKQPSGPFGRGEDFYEKGEYEKAITEYDDYRKKFPRGQRYAQATLKMGLCFQRLKLNRDAKAFYKEVIQRYPNTRASNIAQENMKRL